MKKIILFFALLVFTLACLGKIYCQQTGQFTLSYTDRGITSSLYFWVPADYDSTKSYPFIMGWHGAGDTGGNMRSILAFILAQRINAILVCPDANKVNGQDGTYFSNLTSAAYSQVRQNYNIDTNKIVVMGFSWGGGYSYQIGLLNPHLFKGIIGHAPAIGSLTQAMWDNIKKVRMATILGDKDFNYSAVNSLMLNIQSKGADLLYIIKPGVVHVDNAYFNSQAIIDDYRQCYEYVINSPSPVKEYLSLNGNTNLIISPNPAKEFIEVSKPSEGLQPSEGSANVKIFNVFGETVSTSVCSADTSASGGQRIDVSGLPSGVYFVRVGDKVGKFLKK